MGQEQQRTKKLQVGGNHDKGRSVLIWFWYILYLNIYIFFQEEVCGNEPSLIKPVSRDVCMNKTDNVAAVRIL